MEFCQKQQKIFFSDNGSTAVEVAIKVALQYFFNGAKENDNNCFRKCFSWNTLEQWQLVEFPFVEAFQGMFIDIVRIPVPVKDRNRKVTMLYNL
jgi:adenosylmethionine-8-amino-7-oxononanoate aminotransferase